MVLDGVDCIAGRMIVGEVQVRGTLLSQLPCMVCCHSDEVVFAVFISFGFDKFARKEPMVYPVDYLVYVCGYTLRYLSEI